MSRDSIKVRGNEVVKAVRDGADNVALMNRYGLSQTELAQLFKKLVDGKLIDESELVARRAWLAGEPIIEIEPDRDRDSVSVARSAGTERETTKADAHTERRTGPGIVILTTISTTIFGIFFLIWLFKILGSISAGGQWRFLYLEYNFGGDVILCLFFGILAVIPPVLVYLQSQDYHAPRDAGEAETLAREQRIFWYGFLGTVGIGVAAAYLLPLVAPYQDQEIRVIVTALAKLSWMYFVGRLSWALKQPIIVTIVWCLLSLFGILWIIALVGILISLHLAKRRLREFAGEISPTEQHSLGIDPAWAAVGGVLLCVALLAFFAIIAENKPPSPVQNQPPSAATGSRSQAIPRPGAEPVDASPQWLSRPYKLNAKLSKAVRSGDIEAAREVLNENSNLLLNSCTIVCRARGA